MKILHPPICRHPGVTLRQLERSDAAAWYAYLRLQVVFEHTSWNLSSECDLLPLFDNIESSAPQSDRRLAIVDSGSLELIGTVGFHTVSDINKTAEIAYDLTPTMWGKGIARAVCATVTSWAFEHLGWVRVQGTVLETNRRSQKVLKSCGYAYEGRLRAYRMVRGTPGDFALFSRLATD
ncbi:GCN5 family acetyltransferase [Robbsia andropogonis]|uniref:GCN5 family acetyltransferase n=1 Tax=Robbsia andropogonis TaxID=28092 RepID=A0A0F5K5W6_9BURK|nr:GNAT family protein [Robbsia andropogonis]KKB64932.1 GCN5 family acetyltransferase [Robbsia andropogonis]MCP1119208.1 GNAT family N-acetyltransferase [Robbsia andropogonis]MCP1128941.1 GNAT family N-acetyltransferase [Robbsia andropogonis]